MYSAAPHKRNNQKAQCFTSIIKRGCAADSYRELPDETCVRQPHANTFDRRTIPSARRQLDQVTSWHATLMIGSSALQSRDRGVSWVGQPSGDNAHDYRDASTSRLCRHKLGDIVGVYRTCFADAVRLCSKNR